VAHDSSSPRTEAYGSSSPRTEAHDYSSVLHTGRGTVTADRHVTVRTSGDVTVTGGALVQRVPLTTQPALMRATLARIEANPQEWQQGSWAVQTACGTAYCAAGHALVEVGARIDVAGQSVEVASLPERVRSRFLRDHVSISEGAQAVLGIDSATADRLFSGGNTLKDLHKLVDEICAGAEPADANGAQQ
jgi:hypothetical protein